MSENNLSILSNKVNPFHGDWEKPVNRLVFAAVPFFFSVGFRRAAATFAPSLFFKKGGQDV